MKPTRSRLRFSLRSFVIVIIALAVCLAIVGRLVRTAERQRYILAQLGPLDGDVWYTDERTPDGFSRGLIRSGDSVEFDWNGLQPRVPNAYFRSLASVSIHADDVPDQLIDELASLPDLQELSVASTVVSRPALQRLKQLRPDIEVHTIWHPRHVSFQQMASVEQLEVALQAPRVVLFVDGDWSMECAAFRPIAAALPASWSAQPDRPSVTWIRVDLSDTDSKATEEFRRWLADHDLPLGGLKQLGAGLVVWFENSKVKAAEWCHQFPTTDSLVTRTSATLEDSR